MEEEWAEIEEFPGYAVSSFGQIYNLKTKYMRKASRNYQGIAMVSMYREYRIYTKSIAVLVAKTFVQEDRWRFNTPIHLDGERMNCRADNLVWRPRPFAIQFHRQFAHEEFHSKTYPVEIIETGDQFENLKAISIHHGLIYTHVAIACEEGYPVFPIEKRVRWVQ